MEDDARTLSEGIGSLISRYTWLVLDGFLFLLLVTFFVTYKDLDAMGQRLVRGAFVMALWIFWLSSVHILVHVRKMAASETMPQWVSWMCFGFKALVLVVFCVWSARNNLL